MKKLCLILGLVVVAGILFWAFRDVIGYATDAGVKVKEADLPEAVRATLAKEAPGAEIEVEIDGKEYELEIAEDGTLLEKEADEADDDDGDDDDDDEEDEEDDD